MKTTIKMRHAIGRMLIPTFLAAGFALLSGCAVSQDQEIQLGEQSRGQFEEQFGGLYPDRVVQDYVNGVGMKVARYAGRADVPWEFRVVNSDQINAFSLPGGFVYITRGLLFNLHNEAQLAGILAHESGHVAHRHSVQQLERAQAIQTGAALVGVAAKSQAAAELSNVVAGVALMQYSRDQEKEADLSGLEYMARAGYPPEALVEDMKIMEGLTQGQAPPEFLSSHPNPENRVQYLTDRIQSEYPGVISSGQTNATAFQRKVLDRRNLVPAAPRTKAPQPARSGNGEQGRPSDPGGRDEQGGS